MHRALTLFILAATAVPAVLAQTPTLAPQSADAPPAAVETMPPPVPTPAYAAGAPMAAPAIECCPIRVADYRTHRSAKRLYRCQESVDLTLCVDNPADCCRQYFAVPVCVPCCCVGEPRVCDTRVGLLGRGYVTYAWDCGFTATVAFRPLHQDVIVSYRAD
ncbi:hypothetical protein Mal64_17850 [Pseudobythopirellula maris]|uniref:Uncharacterized protein n=1 Tax=Pseudobythopirellula maris TaxID=2527991 RepID=A0A5C5ZMI6_9BACT|nr:hypothetical protein [Pseudobythopirellula maris]TWT88306.1 hypothetical protein Mal64_17850 [Pseudobythopirellula maris]